MITHHMKKSGPSFFFFFFFVFCPALIPIPCSTSSQHFPRPLALVMWFLAELAMIATDLAEVVGTAIALKLLFKIPVIYGVLLTVLSVLLIMVAGERSSKLLEVNNKKSLMPDALFPKIP